MCSLLNVSYITYRQSDCFALFSYFKLRWNWPTSPLFRYLFPDHVNNMIFIWCLGLGLEAWCLALSLGRETWCLGLGLGTSVLVTSLYKVPKKWTFRNCLSRTFYKATSSKHGRVAHIAKYSFFLFFSTVYASKQPRHKTGIWQRIFKLFYKWLLYLWQKSYRKCSTNMRRL